MNFPISATASSAVEQQAKLPYLRNKSTATSAQAQLQEMDAETTATTGSAEQAMTQNSQRPEVQQGDTVQQESLHPPTVLSRKHIKTQHCAVSRDHIKGLLGHLHSSNDDRVTEKIKELNGLKCEINGWARDCIKAMMLQESIKLNVNHNCNVVRKFSDIGAAYAKDGSTLMQQKLHQVIYMVFQHQLGLANVMEQQCMKENKVDVDDMLD